MTQVAVHPDEAAFLRYLAYLLEVKGGGGRWPPHVFERLLKLMAHASWEFVPWRVTRGNVELLCVQRPASDPAFPPDPVRGSPWCFAGTNNRGEPLEAAMARVNREHYRSPAGRIGEPKFLGCLNWYREERGPDVGLVFLCRFEGQLPPGARWFRLEQLPEFMVDGHRMMALHVQNALRDLRFQPLFVDDPR